MSPRLTPRRTRMSHTLPVPTTARTSWVVLAAGAALLGWAFLPTFQFMAEKWADDPQYSHGFLVPLFSAYLLWRSNALTRIGPSAPLLGCGLFVVVLGMRWLAGGLLFHQLD